MLLDLGRLLCRLCYRRFVLSLRPVRVTILRVPACTDVVCMYHTRTLSHTHTYMHACPYTNTHARAHTHAYTHARAHTRTHTHTHTHTHHACPYTHRRTYKLHVCTTRTSLYSRVIIPVSLCIRSGCGGQCYPAAIWWTTAGVVWIQPRYVATRAYACVFACMYVCCDVCMYVCMYVCCYVWSYDLVCVHLWHGMCACIHAFMCV